jgi:hypothetical protein
MKTQPTPDGFSVNAILARDSRDRKPFSSTRYIAKPEPNIKPYIYVIKVYKKMFFPF